MNNDYPVYPALIPYLLLWEMGREDLGTSLHKFLTTGILTESIES